MPCHENQPSDGLRKSFIQGKILPVNVVAPKKWTCQKPGWEDLLLDRSLTM